VTKDAVVVAPGLAHGRARGLQAYLLPAVTIPRARRPHRPPTLSLSHTPLKRRRSAGVSVTRRIAGPGAFRGYPHGLTLRVQRGRVRLQWRPATALSYGSLHSTCTAIPPGPRPPSLVAGVYHTSSPRAAVSLGVPSLIFESGPRARFTEACEPRAVRRGLAALWHRNARPSQASSTLGGSRDRCQGHDSRGSHPVAAASWCQACWPLF
jgi:hypothetical protein